MIHLFGNMLFLFFFGQIVEGRLGRRFLPLCLALSVAEGFIIQVVMLGVGDPGPGFGALGFSGVIYGLMVISLVWQPQSHFTCLFWFFAFVRTFEIRILWFAGLYLSFDLLAVVLGGFEMGTPLLHLIGGLLGIAPALWLPNSGWVYLGDWSGLVPPPRTYLDSVAALEEERRRRRAPKRPPRMPQAPEPAEPTGSEMIETARFLAGEGGRPRKALEALAAIDANHLPPSARAEIEEIARRAQARIDSGWIELM